MIKYVTPFGSMVADKQQLFVATRETGTLGVERTIFPGVDPTIRHLPVL